MQNKAIAAIAAAWLLMTLVGIQDSAANPGSSKGSNYLRALDGPIAWKGRRFPLRVWIQPGEGIAGYSPGYGKAVAEAFDDWASASNGRITWKSVDSPKQADITCKWVATENELRRVSGSSESVGTCDLNCNGDGRNAELVSASIYLVVKYKRAPGGGLLPWTDEEMKSVCLHEVGHALGLTGHAPNRDSIMYDLLVVRNGALQFPSHLSAADESTINLLYSGKQ